MENKSVIKYSKKFIEEEINYLKESFLNCYDIPVVYSEKEKYYSFLQLLFEKNSLERDSYLEWVSHLFEKINKDKENISTRLLIFMLDLSRLTCNVSSLYQKYNFEKIIIKDIGYIDYKPNEYNESVIKDYIYSFIYNKAKFLYLNESIESVIMFKKYIQAKNILDIYTFQNLISSFCDIHMFRNKEDILLFIEGDKIEQPKVLEKINSY